MLLPPPVAVGSRVAIVFPAGRPDDDDEDRDGSLALLRQWGLVPVVHDPFRDRVPQNRRGQHADDDAARFMARCFSTSLPDEERARALESAFTDSSCEAVWCGRGGYGCMRILELLDWAKLIPALRRKRFFGYSDITALHLAFQTAVPGLVTFHGPMLVDGAGAIPQSDAARLQGALFAADGVSADRQPLFPPLAGLSLNACGIPSCRSRGGRAMGRLVGGNLALMSAMVGSTWCPSALAARGPTVLCLEDIGEPAYRLDRMWQQLKLSRILLNVVAILLGTFVSADGPGGASESPFAPFEGRHPPPPRHRSVDSTQTDVEHAQSLLVAPEREEAEAFFWREVCGIPTDIPVLWNMSFGHGEVNATLPLGALVVVDSEGAEGAVRLPTAEENAGFNSKI
jgi:muramoyltetrapeptide carboxypeptidase